MRVILREQKGAVIVLAALAMVALLGLTALVVDMGVLYLNRIELVNMVDAAVLAGGKSLPDSPSQAVAVANNFAALNGKPGDVVSPSVGTGNATITVNASRNVNLMFAQVLGFSTKSVTATATASVSSVAGATGIVPLGVEQQIFVYGRTYKLKVGGGCGSTGNYGPLALGGTGGNNYKNNIINGYDGTLRVGDYVDTEPGNKVGPTDQGVSARINKDPCATFETAQAGSDRIIIVPVVESMDVNGRKPVKIVGFAGFFLEGSSGGVVKGKFIKLYTGNTIPGTGGNYGLYDLRLTH